MTYVEEVFLIIFPQGNKDLTEGEKAALIVDNFNVPTIGEESALKCLCDIAVRTHFIDPVEGERVVRHSLELITELLPLDVNHEYHVAEASAVLYMFEEGKTYEEVTNAFKRRSY